MLRVICISMCVLYSSVSIAGESIYVSGKVGKAFPTGNYTETNLGFVDFDFDGGTDYSLSVGRNITHYGLELEYSKRELSANSRVIITSNSTESLRGRQIQEDVFANAYYYPLRNSSFSLYIGAGVGLTVIKWSNINSDIFTGNINSVDYVHSYKGILGSSIKISDKIDFETSIQYLVIDDINLIASDGSPGKMDNQDIQKINIGIRYKF